MPSGSGSSVGEVVRRADHAAPDVGRLARRLVMELLRVVEEDQRAIAPERAGQLVEDRNRLDDRESASGRARRRIATQPHRLGPTGRGEDASGFQLRSIVEDDPVDFPLLGDVIRLTGDRSRNSPPTCLELLQSVA